MAIKVKIDGGVDVDIETDEEIFIQGENNNETGEVSDE